MARSQRTSNPVTLFPFLAVLLCTIGALVLMLVVVSAGIRKDAVATAKQKSEAEAVAKLEQGTQRVVPNPAELEPKVEEPFVVVQQPTREQQPIEPLLARDPLPSPIKEAAPRTLAEIADLEQVAKKLEAEVTSRAKRLKSVNVKTHALRKQLRTVKAQQSDIQLQIIRTANQRAKLEESTGELRVENQQIIEWLDESRKLIDDHKDQLVSPVHSIVPYDGQTGTVRRAIIIECVGDVVRFEAEQIEIPVAILQKFSPQQNPLASGVQALFRYWMAKEQISDPGRRSRKPYALVLVRPSGAEAFSSAVFAMDGMVGDFGYELVETDFLYEIPETTADAVRECRAAVEAEIRRGPIRARRTLNPQGPIDIARVARGPAASRSFFGSSDFRNRNSVVATGDSEQGKGSAAEEADGAVGESFAAAAARREAEAKTAVERAKRLLNGRSAEAASLLNKGTPAQFDDARAAVLAEAARVEAELRRNGRATPTGLSEAFRQELAARAGSPGLTDQPLGQPGSPFSGQTMKGLPDPSGTSAGVASGDGTSTKPVDGAGPDDETKDGTSRRGNLSENSKPESKLSSGPPRWIDSSGDRPAVGNGEAVGQGGGKGEIETDGGKDGGERGDALASDRNLTSGSNDRGDSGSGQEQADSPWQTSDGAARKKASTDGRASQGQSVGKRSTSDGQEISSLVNRSTGSAAGSSSSTSSSGGESSSVASGGPVIPTRTRSNRIPSLKTQRRWGRSHPNASLGLEKVVEIRIESNRIVVGNQFQVTRTAERSEAELVKLTIQTIEHLANQWGLPPPRFYWVPSVRYVFEPSEQRLGMMLEVAVEDAGAALE